jgi:hypothetical protein
LINPVLLALPILPRDSLTLRAAGRGGRKRRKAYGGERALDSRPTGEKSEPRKRDGIQAGNINVYSGFHPR